MPSKSGAKRPIAKQASLRVHSGNKEQANWCFHAVFDTGFTQNTSFLGSRF